MSFFSDLKELCLKHRVGGLAEVRITSAGVGSDGVCKAHAYCSIDFKWEGVPEEVKQLYHHLYKGGHIL